MIKGREEEALRTLARLHARGNANDLFVRGEFDLMRSKVLEEAAMDQSWSLVSLHSRVELTGRSLATAPTSAKSSTASSFSFPFK
jgi:hypothetical protein